MIVLEQTEHVQIEHDDPERMLESFYGHFNTFYFAVKLGRSWNPFSLLDQS